MNLLAGWENFYVIVGSSAGALIGLQFVVMTLIADIPARQGIEQAGSAFATPTIVHFGAVLLLAGIQTAPWGGLRPVALVWSILGICGLIYMAVTTWRMRFQTAYRPVLEDWIFHSLLPLIAYALLSVSAFSARFDERSSLFGVAASAMLLLFIGIHNAWDAVTYHVLVRRQKQQ